MRRGRRAGRARPSRPDPPAWDPDCGAPGGDAASGTLFDPACVEAFLHVVAETGLAPERTAADLEELITGCHPNRATSGGDTGASPGALVLQTPR